MGATMLCDTDEPRLHSFLRVCQATGPYLEQANPPSSGETSQFNPTAAPLYVPALT